MIFSIIDIETTGGSPKESKVTEIAIYKHDGTTILDSYSTLINPEMPIPPFISNLTGINDGMVADAPRFHEVAKDIVEFTKDTIFVAHNVAFDYGILRLEFKSLGYDYRLEHLCTVKTSRMVLPGHESYSLGKLTKDLGIDLIGRHRAGGDALATAKLFTILYKTDPNNLETFIQKELNPKNLHPDLNLNELDEIPNKVGVYKLFNDVNQLIYIGKSKHVKKRIEQHLRNNKTKKSTQMIQEIARVEYELCGSELIALIYESELIKQHQPKYNAALKRNKFPYGIFSYTDGNKYTRLFIDSVSKNRDLPHFTFKSKAEANNFLISKTEQFKLCQKLCGLFNSNSSCFEYTIKTCNGACLSKEAPELYNIRVDAFLNSGDFKTQSFYIIDKGRKKQERSLVLIENGMFIGYGYAAFNFYKSPVERWKRYITIHKEDRDTKTIIRSFLKGNTEISIQDI